MNKVILIGRLTANPDYKQTPQGVAVCRFNIAVNRPYQKDKEQEADFISCQAWRNTADFVSRFFTKGKPILIEGSLRNNNYTDKNGVNHYGMEVLVSNAEFTISDNTQNQQQGQTQGNYYQQPQQPPQQQYNGYGRYQQAPQQYQHNNQYQQAPPPNANYKQNSPQYQQPPQSYQQAQYQQQPQPSQPVQQNVNNLNNSEEVISDGEIPF